TGDPIVAATSMQDRRYDCVSSTSLFEACTSSRPGGMTPPITPASPALASTSRVRPASMSSTDSKGSSIASNPQAATRGAISDRDSSVIGEYQTNVLTP